MNRKISLLFRKIPHSLKLGLLQKLNNNLGLFLNVWELVYTQKGGKSTIWVISFPSHSHPRHLASGPTPWFSCASGRSESATRPVNLHAASTLSQTFPSPTLNLFSAMQAQAQVMNLNWKRRWAPGYHFLPNTKQDVEAEHRCRQLDDKKIILIS